MDSFNFVELLPEEITEIIFNKLGCDDLLNAMQVHSTWNDRIGSSKANMNLIKLRLSDKLIEASGPTELCETLKESRRQYQHLELNLYGSKTYSLMDVIDLQDWKSFKVRSQINLSRGKQLVDKLVERCRNLVSLDLQFNWLDLIGNLLKENEGIKILRLKGRLECDDIFENLNLKLQTLSLDTWRDYNRAPDGNPQVFNAFLKSQVDTLTSLSIDFGSYGPYLDQITLQIIMKMPKLMSLSINIESQFLQPNQAIDDLEENHSVVDLKLLLNFHNIIQWGLDNETKSFMEKFRNVKTLTIKELHRKVFQAIENFFPTLEELTIDDTLYMSSDTTNANSFPNLRKVKVGRAINPELERSLKNATEDEMGNFSRCLLEELQNHPNIEREYRSAANYPTLALLASDLQ